MSREGAVAASPSSLIIPWICPRGFRASLEIADKRSSSTRLGDHHDAHAYSSFFPLVLYCGTEDAFISTSKKSASFKSKSSPFLSPATPASGLDYLVGDVVR